MKHLIIYLILCLPIGDTFNNLNAEIPKSVNDCSVSQLIRLDLSHLNDSDILNFFNLLKVECTYNVEFLELHNELLFKIIDLYPEKSEIALRKTDWMVKKMILSELTMPINDGINMQEIETKFADIESSYIGNAIRLSLDYQNRIEGDLELYTSKYVDNKSGFNFETLKYADFDLDGDNISDSIIVLNNKLNGSKTIEVFVSSLNSSSVLNNIVNENLSWVSFFSVLRDKPVILRTLILEETGDILGVDVENSFKSANDVLLLKAEESGGELIVFFKNGKVNYLYD